MEAHIVHNRGNCLDYAAGATTRCLAAPNRAKRCGVDWRGLIGSPQNEVAPAERSSAVTMDRIIAAAKVVFGRKGLDGATIEDIARAARVSKQLIYHYFSSKVDLYSEMLVVISQESYEQFLAIDRDNTMEPEQVIRGWVSALYDRYREHVYSARITLDQGLHAGAQVRYDKKGEMLRNEWRAKLQGALSRGHEAGIFNPELTVDQIHFMGVVMVTGCTSYPEMFTRYTGVNLEQPERSTYWREFCVDFFMRALRS
jgi:TetR/AcrR family transcriptional regulator